MQNVAQLIRTLPKRTTTGGKLVVSCSSNQINSSHQLSIFNSL